jgi:type I restriction enzyme R subunit
MPRGLPSAAAKRAFNLREKRAYHEYAEAHGRVKGGQRGFRALMRSRPVAQRPLSLLGTRQRAKRETALRVLGRSRRFNEPLSKAFALSVPDERALAIRDDVGFYQAVRAALAKATVEGRKTTEGLDSAVRQIVSKAVVSDEVVDIFSAAGLKKPELSIFSDEFLDEVRRLPYRNLALEVLRKLLNDETKTWSKRNLILGRQFSEMLEATIRKYQSRSIDAAQVISSLIDLAKSMKDARDRGAMLGLTQEEEAFYDALVAADETAIGVLGDAPLREIAKQLVETVRKNVSIDWSVKETVRAKLRLYVKRVLKQRGYLPSGQESATQTVLQQAELHCAGWT